jgi:ribokinase
VVGSINIDLVVTGSRLPVPGETVSGGVFERFGGGKGANQALAARRQGAEVTLIGATGNDPLANEALRIVREAGVDISRVVSLDDVSTGVALIVVDERGENQIAVAGGANHQLNPALVDVAGFDVVLCQEEIPEEVVVAAALQAERLFIVNAAPARWLPQSVLDRADVIIVNETENETLRDQLVSFQGLLVVTKGSQGAEASKGGVRVSAAVPPKVEAIDTVGAGDSFCGAFAVELARSGDVDEALKRGCYAGAIAATRNGAQASLPTAADLESVMAG